MEMKLIKILLKNLNNDSHTVELIFKDNTIIRLYFCCNILMGIKGIDNVYYISENIKSNSIIDDYINTININKDVRLKREIFIKIANKIIKKYFSNHKMFEIK